MMSAALSVRSAPRLERQAIGAAHHAHLLAQPYRPGGPRSPAHLLARPQLTAFETAHRLVGPGHCGGLDGCRLSLQAHDTRYPFARWRDCKASVTRINPDVTVISSSAVRPLRLIGAYTDFRNWVRSPDGCSVTRASAHASGRPTCGASSPGGCHGAAPPAPMPRRWPAPASRWWRALLANARGRDSR